MVLAGGPVALLVRMLTRAVRVVTAAQLARHLWKGADEVRAGDSRRLRMLVRGGLLISTRVRAHPELDLAAPVWTWAPGDPEPPFGVLELSGSDSMV